MLNRAHRLSSSPDLFAAECDNLKEIFFKLKYPVGLMNSTINRFIELFILKLESGLWKITQNSNLRQNKCLNVRFQAVKNGKKKDLNN